MYRTERTEERTIVGAVFWSIAQGRRAACGEYAAGEVQIMVIESRTIVGGAAAFALVGAVLWGSTILLDPQPAPVSAGSVEISSVGEKAWMVEVQDLAPTEKNRTAASR